MHKKAAFGNNLSFNPGFFKSAPEQAGPPDSPWEWEQWWVLMRGWSPEGKEWAAGSYPGRASSGLTFLSCLLPDMNVHCCSILGACFPPFQHPAENLQDTRRGIQEPVTGPFLCTASHRRRDWSVSQISFYWHFPDFCYVFLESLAMYQYQGLGLARAGFCHCKRVWRELS